MQRFWSWLAVELGKRAGVVALVGLILTLGLGFGATKLKFATGQESYLNADDQVAIDNVEYQKLFGGEAMLTLITLDPGRNLVDVLNPENQRKIEAAADTLRQRDDLIEYVVTPMSGLQLADRFVTTAGGKPVTSPAESDAGKALLAAIERDDNKESATLRFASSKKTSDRVSEIPVNERVLENAKWRRFLLYDNEDKIRESLRPLFPASAPGAAEQDNHTQIIVRLKGNIDLDVQGEAVDLVQQTMGTLDIDGASTTTTGAAQLLDDINDYLKGGLVMLGGIAIAVMSLILVLFFNVRWRLLPLAVIVIGVTWAFGLAGWMGIPLSVVTIAGLPVMLGVGIDYAIQMHARVEEEVILDKETHPIQETARNLCPALLVVTFDAIFAFAALRFAKVPMIRDFGLLLAVGIAVICLASIIVPLATLGIREFKSPTKVKGDFSEGLLGRFVVKIGSLPIMLAPILAIASVAIFVGGAVVEEKLELQTDPIQWVNADSETRQDIDKIIEETGSSSELAVYVKTNDIFSDENIRWTSDFVKRERAEHPKDLLTASNIVMTVQYLMDVPGTQPTYPRPQDVRAAYDAAPDDLKELFARPDDGAINLVFRYGEGSLEQRAEVIEELRGSMNTPASITATPSGLAVVGVGLLHNLEANRILLTYLSIAFVGLFLAIRLKSLVRSLLSLVPVLIAVGMASIVAFVFSLKLSPMTAVGGPLVIAVCTEFTSLILLRFIEERQRGLDPKEAADIAAARTGRAFIVSGMTAVAGVGVIATSNLPLLRDFGLIVAMNVVVALASALIVLPPLMIWADERGWVTKGMLPDVPLGTDPWSDEPVDVRASRRTPDPGYATHPGYEPTVRVPGSPSSDPLHSGAGNGGTSARTGISPGGNGNGNGNGNGATNGGTDKFTVIAGGGARRQNKRR